MNDARVTVKSDRDQHHSKMRILHLVDDWVFTDGPVNVFKGFDVENRFVVLRQTDDKTLRRVKSPDVEVVQVGTSEYKGLLDSGKWDLVWVYNLVPAKAKLVSALGKSVPVVWSVYGVDYIKYSGHWLYGWRTTRQFMKLASARTVATTIAKCLAGRLGISRFLPFWDCQFFNRVNYFSCVVPEEESWIRGAVGRRKSVKRVNFHFCSREGADRALYPLVNLSAKRVWVGNSATLSNNHLDIFSAISKTASNNEYCIVSPLSYSYDVGADKLVQVVTTAGIRFFGDRFSAINEIIPRVNYIRIMSSCSVFVFGVRRQQAGGNTYIALRCGGCVFLDRRNPVYEHYRKMGVVVYPLERIAEGFDTIVEEFRPHQIRNVEILFNQGNADRMIGEIKETVEFLKKDILSPGEGRTNE